MLDDSCRVAEATVDGDRCLTLENAQVRVTINVDHGAHLYELVDRRSGTNLLHHDALGSRHYRVGGWFELFPNAGPACIYDGHELSKAGDIQHRPWTHLIRTAGRDLIDVELSADSRDLPLRLTKTIRFGSAIPGVLVSATVTNLADSPQRFLWGQHITFGEAFMTASSRIDLPDVEFHARGRHPKGAPYAPNARGRLAALPAAGGRTVDLTTFPAEPFTAMLFSDPLPQHWYNVWADDIGAGLAVGWDGDTYPVLWLWATRNGHPGDPAAVACALEPQASAVPALSSAAAAGTALAVGPRQSRSTWVRAVLHHDPAPVSSVDANGTVNRLTGPSTQHEIGDVATHDGSRALRPPRS